MGPFKEKYDNILATIFAAYTTLRLDSGIIYDLSGRQLPSQRKGQPYILNGKVYINR